MVKDMVKKMAIETVGGQDESKEVVKKRQVSSGKKKMTARERDELLIENFVGLQHAMTNMSVKFGMLSDNISKLLQIFEESAKNFISGDRKTSDAEMLKKIDSLLNQNKTIAKGLVLMEGSLRGRSEEPPMATAPYRAENLPPKPKPLPRP
ncbi:hypothetical protein KAT36_00465 [Candidatus Pacearchaeota archaeon]|nr:hypothetical protein [Candidatus Pacearchaeota archaeon]